MVINGSDYHIKPLKYHNLFLIVYMAMISYKADDDCHINRSKNNDSSFK